MLNLVVHEPPMFQFYGRWIWCWHSQTRLWALSRKTPADTENIGLFFCVCGFWGFDGLGWLIRCFLSGCIWCVLVYCLLILVDVYRWCSGLWLLSDRLPMTGGLVMWRSPWAPETNAEPRPERWLGDHLVWAWSDGRKSNYQWWELPTTLPS